MRSCFDMESVFYLLRGKTICMGWFLWLAIFGLESIELKWRNILKFKTQCSNPFVLYKFLKFFKCRNILLQAEKNIATFDSHSRIMMIWRLSSYYYSYGTYDFRWIQSVYQVNQTDKSDNSRLFMNFLSFRSMELKFLSLRKALL